MICFFGLEEKRQYNAIYVIMTYIECRLLDENIKKVKGPNMSRNEFVILLDEYSISTAFFSRACAFCMKGH